MNFIPGRVGNLMGEGTGLRDLQYLWGPGGKNEWTWEISQGLHSSTVSPRPTLRAARRWARSDCPPDHQCTGRAHRSCWSWEAQLPGLITTWTGPAKMFIYVFSVCILCVQNAALLSHLTWVGYFRGFQVSLGLNLGPATRMAWWKGKALRTPSSVVTTVSWERCCADPVGPVPPLPSSTVKESSDFWLDAQWLQCGCSISLPTISFFWYQPISLFFSKHQAFHDF